MTMEKYGVCKVCYGKDSPEGLTKLATGEYKCPQCGKVVITKLELHEEIRVRDEDEDKK